MTYETIVLEKTNGAAIITLNRPDRHNAFNRKMGMELEDAWQRVKSDDEIRDVTEIASLGGIPDELHPRNLAITALMNRVWKPVITAVNGICLGGGFHFIADSDIVICSDNATFFDTHVRVGQVFGMEPVALSRRIPLEAVLRMTFLAGEERLDAQRALQLGLVSEVVALPKLRERAMELASVVTRNSPATMMASKRAIWEGLDMGLEAALARSIEIIEEHWKHPDYVEGPRAFAEKRPPQWAPVKSQKKDKEG